MCHDGSGLRHNGCVYLHLRGVGCVVGCGCVCVCVLVMLEMCHEWMCKYTVQSRTF